MKKLGSLYGADVMIDTDDEKVWKDAVAWLETMDKRYRQFNEPPFESK